MWRQSRLALCLIAASLPLLSSATVAEDRRSIIPKDVETELIRFEPTKETPRGFLAKYPEGDFVKLFQAAGDARVSFAHRDLNGDGNPEIITLLAGPVTCGARDCEVVILKPEGKSHRTIFDGYASSVALGAKAKDGWRDVITNLTTNSDNVKSGVVWTWTGERYEIK